MTAFQVFWTDTATLELGKFNPSENDFEQIREAERSINPNSDPPVLFNPIGETYRIIAGGRFYLVYKEVSGAEIEIQGVSLRTISSTA